MERRNKILIVEDNAVNNMILEAILGDEYQLQTATSGEQALEMAPDFQPDLVLLDIMLPGLNGYDTCRQLRALPALRHTRIIMVSAKTMVAERLLGYKVGAADYVTKPYDPEELQAKVQIYLQLRFLEELHQLKSDLLTLLSSETATPLNGILPVIELLLADEAMTAEERTKLLTMAHRSALRLHKFFQKGKALCAMKAGSWPFHLVPADLCSVIRAAVREVAAQVGDRQVQIEQMLPETAPTLLDPKEMQGMVVALLENAIRFSPAQGRVVIGVSSENQHFRLTVTDQGPGIEPAFLPQVFQEFAHADISHHTEGQGLSLAIARQVVLAHKGTVGVESTPQAGATFTVCIPIVGKGQSDDTRAH